MSDNSRGHLQVDPMHNIYYDHSGNLDGPTILFVHGGPGLGTSARNKSFFDLKQVNVILFDQRGCGLSAPTGELEGNDTLSIIGDMIRLLDYLKIDKVTLFGGSWGSTLSLLFGSLHPNRVESMVLRGVFTATTKERQHFERGGVQLFFPKAWARFISQVPAAYNGDPIDYYFETILNDTRMREKLSYELMRYGLSVSRHLPMTDQEMDITLHGNGHVVEAVILSHFTVNNFFIPDGYILDNLENLEGIPIRIVQGRYDMITPPEVAIEISERLTSAEVVLVEGGHSASEGMVREELVKLVLLLTK